MSRRTLYWPRRIARVDRLPLSIGHGSFCLPRVHLGDDAFDRQPIRLTGYLLVVVCEGSVILDGASSSVLLQEGDAALIPPGHFAVAEIPRPQFTKGETLYYLFNQRTLADLVAKRGSIDELMARVALPALPFYPVRRLGEALNAAMAGGTVKSMTDLRAVFTGLLNRGTALMCNFLKHEYFIPRFRLCFFLEDHCRGRLDLNRIASRYPRGAQAFRRDCTFYLGIAIAPWLFRRRTELAQAWLRYTEATEGDVAGRLGYDSLRQFHGDLKRWGRFSPLEYSVLRLLSPVEANRETLLPFWFPDAEARLAKHRQYNSDFCTIAMLAKTRSAQRALLKMYPETERRPAGELGEVSLPLGHLSGSGDGVCEEQETGLDNVITWEAVEKWRTGGASLSGRVPNFAIAA